MNVSDLIQKAQDLTGLTEWGDGPDVERWLGVLASDLNEIPSQGNAGMWRKQLVAALTHRLYLAKVQPNPWFTKKIPVLISGYTRSGTTLLHELVALQPGHRAPTVTEARWPAEIHQGGSVASQAVAETLDYWSVLENVVPRFQMMHEIRPDGPEEMRVLLEPSLMSHSFTILWNVPRFTALLESSDMRPAWEMVCRTLVMLDDRRRWILKDPSHIFALDSFLDVIPSQVITITRDWREAIPSSCSLMRYAQEVTCGSVSEDIGAWILSKFASDAKAQMRALRDRNHLPLTYSELVTDPIGTMRRVMDYLGGEFDEDATHRFLQEHPKDKRGKHDYSAQRFGLDDALIRSTQRAATGGSDGTFG